MSRFWGVVSTSDEIVQSIFKEVWIQYLCWPYIGPLWYNWNNKKTAWIKNWKKILNGFCTTRLGIRGTASYWQKYIAFGQSFQWEKPNNTRLLHKGKHHCTIDLLFDWFGFNQRSKSAVIFNVTKLILPLNIK